jgi:hypothetical protein
MGMFTFILIIVVLSGIIAPIAKGLGDRLAKGSPDTDHLAKLKAELDQADQRLADAERRLLLAEERLDFQEKLLSTRSSASRLPRVDS